MTSERNAGGKPSDMNRATGLRSSTDADQPPAVLGILAVHGPHKSAGWKSTLHSRIAGASDPATVNAPVKWNK
jgi:hypothetical protein